MSEDKIDEQIIKYIKQGKTIGQISQILNCPRSYIKNYVMEMVEAGVDLNREDNKEEIDGQILELKAEGMNDDEIAKEVKKSVAYVKKISEMNKIGVDISKFNKVRNFGETDKQIKQMIEEGLNYSEISRKIGISKQRVSQRIKKLAEYDILTTKNEKKIEQNRQILQMREEGLSQSEIAKKLGIEPYIVSYRLKKMKEAGIEIPDIQNPKRKKSLDERDMQILQMREEGLSQSEIARRIGIRQTTVSEKLKKMKEAGIEIPDIQNPKRKKSLDERDMQILQMREEGLSQSEIAKRIGIYQTSISHRLKKIKELENSKKEILNEKTAKYINLSKEEIEQAILNLAKTRNATFEQMQEIAQSYDIDLSRTLYSVDMDER